MDSNSSLSICEALNDSLASNSTSELWLVEDKVTGQVSATFLLLILVVGLPWNLLVVLTIVKEKLYHQPTIILLLNLAVNDIMWLIFLFPQQLVVGFTGEFIFGSTNRMRCIWCGSGATNFLFSLMSVNTIALMSLDRFLFIYKPLHYNKIVTRRRVVAVLIHLWLSLILPAVLPLLGLSVFFYPPFLHCVPDFSGSNIWRLVLVVFYSVVPVIMLLVFNVWLAVIVHKNIRAIYAARRTLSHLNKHNSLQNDVKKIRSQKELHLIQVFGALLGSSLVSWLPILTVVLYLMIARPSDGGRPVKELIATCYVLYVAQTAVHPIIETFLIKDVRKPMKKLLLCWCVKKRRKSEVASDEREKRLSCECSCCPEFMSVLQAAVLDHGHSEQEQSKSDTTEAKDSAV